MENKITKKIVNPFGLDKYLIGAKKHNLDPNGFHYYFRFPNGFGASIIQTNFSYGSQADGTWEMCLLCENNSGELKVCTDINLIPQKLLGAFNGDYVTGYLSIKEVNALLNTIKDFFPD